MNEHEASVANRITAKGHPLMTVLAILAMKRNQPRPGRTLTIGSAIAVVTAYLFHTSGSF